jgi:DNA-binding transcriptional MerR regulator
MERLTIGQLAKQASVNRETVRYYERRRLLQRPSRSIAGYRVFSDEALQRLRFIRHAKSLGFSLEEIRELLALRVGRSTHVIGCGGERKPRSAILSGRSTHFSESSAPSANWLPPVHVDGRRKNARSWIASKIAEI